jgi:RimJ/RimL family protein N-acetyltransferase
MYDVRIATEEDIDLVVSLTTKALESTRYVDMIDELTIRNLAQMFLSSSRETHIILLYKDYGLIAGVCTPFIFGLDNVATEVGIWIEPSERGAKAGSELIEAFEYWANKLNCKLITFTAVNEKMKKYFEDKEYVLYEQSLVKVL